MSASVLVLPPTTPPDYHRIVSSLLQLPTDPLKPIPVGLLACQRDPLLRELQSTVTSCQVAKSQPTPSKRRKEKGPQVPQDQLLEVILHDTILFPEGGGQPHDTGLFTAQDGSKWDVVDVKRHGGHAVHYVRVQGSSEEAMKAFSLGSTVGISLGDNGLQRRLDHMCMHTSQHLLSAVLEARLNLPTLSWSLTAYPTPSYVEIPRSMSASEIASIQDEANRFVFEGRSVHIEVEELDSENTPGIAKLENGRSVGKALPTDYTGGVKRTVIIEGVDRNPCCGTHLPSLHNLQLFLIPHTESVARSTTSSARLYFLSGPRLITYLTSTHSYLAATAATLSCGAPQVPERVELVVEERKKASKRVEDLEYELANQIAEGFVASSGGGEGPLLLHNHRTDDSSNTLGFLSSISTAFSNEITNTSSSRPYLLVLSSSPSMQTTSSTTVVMVFGNDEKQVKVVGDALKAKLSVKGGGKGTKWSGKFVGVWKENRESAQVDEILESIKATL